MNACHAFKIIAALAVFAFSQSRWSVASASDVFSLNGQAAPTAIAKKGMIEQRQPGLVVGVWLPGRGDWTASFGKADIDAEVPMRGTDHVRIASITKTFVANAILQLAWTAGAMISTRADLRIWARALATGAPLKPETHALQLQFAPLTGAVGGGYGLGIAKFGDFIGQNGAILGYFTAMFYLPEVDATFVVATNQSSNFSNATTDIFFALAKHLFPERFGKPK